MKLLKRAVTLSTMLDLLEVPCGSEGCSVKTSFDGMKSHENSCEFVVGSCHNRDCEFKAQRKLLKEHEQRCPHLLRKCEHCQKQIKQQDLSAHETSCPQRIVVCKYKGCEVRLKAFEFNQHSNECDFKPCKCQWCGVEVYQKTLAAHQGACDKKQVECIGCRKLFPQSEYVRHSNECEEVVVHCEMCEQRFSRKGLSAHSLMKCLVETVKDLKRQNSRLWEQNGQLRQCIARIELGMENFSNEKQKQISMSVMENMRLQQLSVVEKDLQRVINSINSIEKLKKEEVQAHMKYPHLIESWCVFCKDIERKFSKMLDPLLQKKREYEQRKSQYLRYNKTRKG